MRKNKKIPKKFSAVAGTATHLGAIIVVFVVMVILNILAASSCSQLQKSIGAKEKQLALIEKDLSREISRWQAMTTPDNIEDALLHHGLKMGAPRPEQTIRIMQNGRPRPGQLSLSRIRNSEKFAKNAPRARRR